MPTIRVMLGDTEVHRCAFDRDIISIGRSRDNEVVVENLAVSRNHARIRRLEDGRYMLSDLSSANGTFVNGVQATKIEIKHGDKITIGKHVLIFEDSKVSDAEMIGEAFGADRTIIVERVPNARLLVIKGKQQDQETLLTKYETTIGRGADVDIRVSDWFASKRHAVILRQGTKFFIKDLGSWMGTFVNSQRVKEAPLSPGDEIKIGSSIFRFLIALDEDTMQISPEVIARKAGGRLPIIAQPLMPPSNLMAGKRRGEGSNDTMLEAFEPVPSESPSDLAPTMKAVPHPEDEPAPGAEEKPMDSESPAAQPPSTSEAPALDAQPMEEPSAGERSAAEEPAPPQPDIEPPSGEQCAEPKPEDTVDEDITSKNIRFVPSAAPGEGQGDPQAHEVAMWERALTNRSLAVRREAAKMLKKLTGKDYDV